MTNKQFINYNITDKDFFYCYDADLSHYFKKEGINYVLKANSVKDGKTFTMFQKSESLYAAFDKFTQHKRSI